MQAIQSQTDVFTQPFEESRKHFEDIVVALTSEKVQAMTHSDVEKLLHAEGIELLRQLYQGFLDGLGDGAAVSEVRNAQGVILTHHVREGRKLEVLFGTVELGRCGYRHHETSVLYPLDARLNLPVHRYSQGVEQRVSEDAAKMSYDETVAAVGATTGAHVPKRQAEEIVVRAAADFDEFYQQAERTVASETGPILVLTADGKGIVMRKKDLREPTRLAAEQEEHRLTTRLSKGEKRDRKRMAEVAAVYTIERHVRAAEDVLGKLRPVGQHAPLPPKPEHKRVWASVEKEPQQVLKEAFQEALRRDPERTKTWVALVDGNKSQIKAIRQLAKEDGVQVTIVVDFIHVLEYLWRAGNALLGEGQRETEDWVVERALRLLRGDASQVAAGIRRSATLRNVTGSTRKAMDRCADYLLKNSPYLKYDQCLREGYPIATGVIEGACRHLVKDRMGRTGASWGLKGAEAILRLRALYSSGDLEAYWRFHEKQEYQRNHASRYFNNTPAPTTKPRRSHLRVVK